MPSSPLSVPRDAHQVLFLRFLLAAWLSLSALTLPPPAHASSAAKSSRDFVSAQAAGVTMEWQLFFYEKNGHHYIWVPPAHLQVHAASRMFASGCIGCLNWPQTASPMFIPVDAKVSHQDDPAIAWQLLFSDPTLDAPAAKFTANADGSHQLVCDSYPIPLNLAPSGIKAQLFERARFARGANVQPLALLRIPWTDEYFYIEMDGDVVLERLDPVQHRDKVRVFHGYQSTGKPKLLSGLRLIGTLGHYLFKDTKTGATLAFSFQGDSQWSAGDPAKPSHRQTTKQLQYVPFTTGPAGSILLVRKLFAPDLQNLPCAYRD